MSRVRGPNSALTEFLRSQGISASEIKNRYEEQRELERETEGLEYLGAAKKADDDAAEDEDPDELDPTRIPKGTEFCKKCNTRFTLTIYSSRFEDGYLCVACSKASQKKRSKAGGDQAAKKQRKKIAAALLDKQDARGAKAFQDLCIRTIAKYIDDVELLGDIGAVNMQKISKILTRNRKLNDQTLKLFLGPDVKCLEIWDCSELTPASYDLIASYCPNLEELVLSMCGQMENEGLEHLCSNLKNLKRLELEGPFLIRKDTWMKAFQILAEHGLNSLAVTDTHRFDDETLAFLVESFAGAKLPLESLRLSRLSGLKDPDAIYLLAELTHLRSLTIANPEPESVSDDAYSIVIRALSSQLEKLVLDGCSPLTDATITAIEQCTALTELSISKLGNITNEAVARLFSNPNFPRLHLLNVSRCIGLGDEAIRNILVHSSSTLVELNLNSLQMVATETLLELLPRCTNLTSINLGFLRCVNNKVIGVLDQNKHLKLIEVYGVPNVTCTTTKAKLIGKQNIDVF